MPFVKVTLSFFGVGECRLDPQTWCFRDGCYLGVLSYFSFISFFLFFVTV
jgi:hypothetical protein